MVCKILSSDSASHMSAFETIGVRVWWLSARTECDYQQHNENYEQKQQDVDPSAFNDDTSTRPTRLELRAGPEIKKHRA
jgi:hypothetical protein